jgi:hypothetical protein
LRNFAAIVPEEAKRIEALAEQLLDLARPREYNLVECDVHAIILPRELVWLRCSLSINRTLRAFQIGQREGGFERFLNVCLSGF